MLPCQRWPGTGNSAAPTGRGFAGRLCASSIGLLTGRSLGLFRPPSRERYLCQLLQQWRNQSIVDAILLDIDGNQNTSQLGANAILGVSLSVCKAGAGVKGVPLYKHIQELAGIQELVIPIPSCNVMKGSSHAGTNLIMQEFLLLPIEASSFIEVLQDISKAQCRQDACTVVDDGGFAPNFQDNSAGNIETAGYTGKITIGMYVAGSEFPTKDGSYDHNVKNQPNDGAHVLSAQHLGNPFTDLVNDSPIDDPFDQDDWSLWASLQFSVDIQLAGDVLLNTNTDFHLVLRTIQFDCRSS